ASLPILESPCYPYTTLFRSQVRVVVITGLFQACDVFRKDPKRWVLGVLDQGGGQVGAEVEQLVLDTAEQVAYVLGDLAQSQDQRSEQHTSELQSRFDLVCRH